jgi:hypothetical protein
MPWDTLARSLYLFLADPNDLVLRLNLIFFLLACGLVMIRRLRLEYRLYAWASLAMFLTKSSDPVLQSTTRYVLAVFPAPIALARLLENRRYSLALFCGIGAGVNLLFLWAFFRWSLVV